ncbi:helix-turn-helix domain-containing protein [Halobacillus seohaensis]|uniref:Helix-turn-helix domain-containing protein n=1 Tax=Halobacillus seohaensis TaxID=447421 RepID=A0ABW2ENN2_9BACI
METSHFDLFRLLKDCSDSFKTPILVFNHNEKMIRYFPDHFQRPPEIFRPKFYQCLRDSKRYPFQLQLNEGVYYQSFFFYPIQDKTGQLTYIGIGPFLTHEVGKLQVRKLLVLHGLDFSYEEETIQYFETLPIVNKNELESMERLLINLLPKRSEGYSIGQIPTKEMQEYQEFKSNHLNSKFSRHLLELNEKFNGFFKQGDNRALNEYQKLRRSSLFPLGNGDELRSAKNNIITLVSKLTRIAIEEGVVKGDVFSLHDFYINFLETKEDLTELANLELTIVQAYVNVMKQKTGESRVSPLVNRAQNYIYQNITEDINLKVIADELKVNPNYLSSVFNQNMGISITKYINNKRIKEAKALLSNTQYTLMEISILLGYNSQSYFTRVFKKNEGFSPKEFRQKQQSTISNSQE